MTTRFTLPRDLYFGSGSIEKLADIKGKRALIVLGKESMRKFGFLHSATGYLESAGFKVDTFEGVEPDPTIQTVLNGAEAMKKFEPDVIVAMGGGSVIDAAKAMWVFYENPDLTFDDLLKPFELPKLREKAILVAIPSTSGTSSEVTAFTIVTDNEKGIKYPIVDFEIVPDIAILDSDLTATMSRDLIAFTGMDALTHAIEALVSNSCNDFSEPLAMNAVRLIYLYLYQAHNGDRLAQAKVHYAQYQAGMAFSNSYLGINHSIAHKVGTAFDGINIPHGCLNAICLPQVIRFNAKLEQTAFVYAQIARVVGLKGDTNEELVEALIKSVEDCNKDLGIVSNLQVWNDSIIPEEEFLAKVETIAENAIEDPCTLTNPRRPSKDEMVKLIKCCFYGDPCNI